MARRKRWDGLGQIGRICYIHPQRLLHDIWVRDEFESNVPDEYEIKQGNFGFRPFKTSKKLDYFEMKDLLDLLRDGRLYARSNDIIRYWKVNYIDDGHHKFPIQMDGKLGLEDQEYFSPVHELSVCKFSRKRAIPGFASTRTLYHLVFDLDGKKNWREYVLARRYLSAEVLPQIKAKIESGDLYTRNVLRCTN